MMVALISSQASPNRSSDKIPRLLGGKYGAGLPYSRFWTAENVIGWHIPRISQSIQIELSAPCGAKKATDTTKLEVKTRFRTIASYGRR